jgi:signal peptidase I
MSHATRKPWVAGLLSFLAPGLGHLYAGRPLKGLLIGASLLITVIVFAAIAMAPLGPSPFNVIVGFAMPASVFVFSIMSAVRLARNQGASYQLKAYNKWYLYLGIVLIMACALEGRELLVKAYKMQAGSMALTLLVGEHILVDKLPYRFTSPVRGDVVVFKYPEDETKKIVKRIIGMPGDNIEIRDKIVYVNGHKLPDADYTLRVDPEIIDGRMNPRDNLGPVVVPANSFFVLGDNRDQSLDSRFWGFVHRSKITGRARTIYWSLGESPRWERIGQIIQLAEEKVIAGPGAIIEG